MPIKGLLTTGRAAAVTALAALLTLNTAFAQSSNDHIFPAAPAAKAHIDFDAKGFVINGHRTFLVSAGIEYARVPHELWRDRLLRLQRAGFNCVEMYTFWNWHEQTEGVFNFTGDRDLDAFLKLVHELGMYAIVRVGPYYCAEWEFGGYPEWLRFKPGLSVREPNEAFERYAGRYFDHLLPIVAANQVSRGGSVVLVQLENEHNLGWGTVMPNGYFRFLQQKALSAGIEVPYFFSGLHHDSDPAGESPRLDDNDRPNPWMSTEFWCVWYNGYGSTEKDARTYERRTWKIIARGGNGYNYYMAHGGSNFAYTNNNEDAASYDYGAAVGQGGDLRPVYYAMKRAAWFARSFQDILESSSPGAEGERVSPAGRILFMDNPSDEPMTRIFAADTIHLAPGEIVPIVQDYTVDAGVRIGFCTARIFALTHHTLITYGDPGSHASLQLTVKGNLEQVPLIVSPDGSPRVVKAGPLRVLVMSRDWVDRTWIVDSSIFCGPRYVGEVSAGRVESEDAGGPVLEYTVAGVRRWTPAPLGRAPSPEVVHPTTWVRADGAQAAQPAFDDSRWLSSETPLQMNADGDTTADAWYRTTLSVDRPGDYTLLVQAADRSALFLDGVPDTAPLRDGQAPLTLTAGRHTLAVFTAHDGRDKLAGYTGPVDEVDRKGLFGEALLVNGPPPIQVLQGWRMMVTPDSSVLAAGPPAPTAAGWQPYTIGQDAFHKSQGYGWFQTTLPKPAPGADRMVIRFASVDENARVFIGRRLVAVHNGWNEPFTVIIVPSDTGSLANRPTDTRTLANLPPDSLTLTVFVENYSNEGGIDQPVRAGSFVDPKPVTGWRMRGGPGPIN
ncbi:MAG TPA: beta-galactosidase, partial [Dinghuibacter sp.]|uniref:beta-galactosidase n=1 Tax=Dinghuibacter sp. TaxID=2024697 RepID=UPI002B89ED5F